MSRIAYVSNEPISFPNPIDTDALLRWSAVFRHHLPQWPQPHRQVPGHVVSLGACPSTPFGLRPRP